MTLKEATDQLVRVCKESDAKKIIGLEKRLTEAKSKIERLKSEVDKSTMTKYRLEHLIKENRMLKAKIDENM